MNKKREKGYRTNRQIRVPEVRLVGDNVDVGVFETREALSIAENMELDLVEISPGAKPPVCRIIDYQKFLYDKKRRDKETLKKQKANQVQIKEIRLTPNTDEHDFNFKVNHAIGFLKNNNKVKATIFFRGREITFRDKGELMLLKFVEALDEHGSAETLPKLEGKRMSLFVKPNK